MNSNKLLTAKAHDWSRQVAKKQARMFFDFFDPASQEKIADVLKEYEQIDFAFYGGTEFAERKMLCVFPKGECVEEKEYAIDVIEFDKNDDITHRDILGALMGIGISREKTGDIVFGSSKAYIYLKENISDYVLTHLLKVANHTVCPMKADRENIVVAEAESKEFHIIVASMRADGIISAAFRLSRSASLQFIKAERVKLNHRLLLKQAKELKEGDLISIRGKGRMQIVEQTGKTRKGNIKLTVKRYV